MRRQRPRGFWRFRLRVRGIGWPILSRLHRERVGHPVLVADRPLDVTGRAGRPVSARSYSAAISSCSPSMRMSSSSRSSASMADATSCWTAAALPQAPVRAGRCGSAPCRCRRDEAADDDVLLEAAQGVDRAVDGGLGEHAGGLLEARRRDEAVGGERRLGDAQQKRTTDCRRPPLLSTRSFSSLKRKRSVCCSSRKFESPTSSILTQRSIWRTMVSMCLSEMATPCRR